jgi:hypothetical protein
LKPCDLRWVNSCSVITIKALYACPKNTIDTVCIFSGYFCESLGQGLGGRSGSNNDAKRLPFVAV